MELPGDLRTDGYGGFIVKETGTHNICVVPMLYNWRIARQPKASPLTYDRGWCYSGTRVQSLLAAIAAAAAWDGADDTEPAGWNKNIQTGEWRENPDLPGETI